MDNLRISTGAISDDEKVKEVLTGIPASGIPEPASLVLVGVALLTALAFLRRKS
jgi:hypothetical protein